jgi:hypothetical protein
LHNVTARWQDAAGRHATIFEGISMSGSKAQDKGKEKEDDGADVEGLIDDAAKFLNVWKKAIDDIAKDLAKLGKGDKSGKDDDSKGGKGGKGEKAEGGNKDAQQQAQKEADAASKKLSEDLKKMLKGEKPPSDPKEPDKLTKALEKFIDKNGVKLKDWGSVKPDIEIDPKKMQLKKFELQWTWKF